MPRLRGNGDVPGSGRARLTAHPAGEARRLHQSVRPHTQSRSGQNGNRRVHAVVEVIADHAPKLNLVILTAVVDSSGSEALPRHRYPRLPPAKPRPASIHTVMALGSM